MTDFNDLLQSAEQLTSEFDRFHPTVPEHGSGSDLPRVERNLRQLMDVGSQLYSKTAVGAAGSGGQAIGSQDVKASVLLGSKGVDLPTMANALDSLATQASKGTGFEASDLGARDTDVAGFLKGEREAAILSVLEETRKETFEAAEKLHWESSLNQWEKTKKQILDDLTGNCNYRFAASPFGGIFRSSNFLSFFSPFSDEPQDISTTVNLMSETSLVHHNITRTSTLNHLEMTYANQVANYNEKAAKGGLKPDPVVAFSSPFTEEKDQEAHALWSMVSSVTDGLEGPSSKSVVAKAKSYLEKSFLKHVRSVVYSNLRDAQLGGIPGTFRLVKSYLNVRLVPDAPGLEDGTVWPMVYYCLRCGDVSAAVQSCEEAGPGLAEMAKLLSQVQCSPDGRLNPHEENVVRIAYKRSGRSTTDPYKRAVHCVLGACDPDDEHGEIATSLDDYLWIKLSQIRDEEEGLTLEKLQHLMLEEYGEGHFKAFEQPVLYFQVLFLTGQFEAAVDFLFRVERLRSHGVHIGLGLFEKKLLRLPENIQAALLTSTAKAARLNVARMVMLYARKFEATDPKEALNYFYFLREMRTNGKGNLFTACVSELVLESREFDLLVGRILPDGSRMPGLIDRYQEDINGEVNVQNIIKTVAEDSERKGMFEDSIKLYDLAKMHEKVVELLNKLLGQVATQPSILESRRDRLQRMAVEIAKRYSTVGHAASKDPTAAFFLLLDLMTFFDAFHAKKYDDALNIIARIRIVPLDQKDIDHMVSTFRLLVDEVRRNIPDVLLATMNILYNNFETLKNSASGVAGKDFGGKGAQLQKLRDEAKALITFAGIIPYRMPGDTNARLVQMEVLMN